MVGSDSATGGENESEMALGADNISSGEVYEPASTTQAVRRRGSSHAGSEVLAVGRAAAGRLSRAEVLVLQRCTGNAKVARLLRDGTVTRHPTAVNQGPKLEVAGAPCRSQT